jgi:hypothetical protein
MNDYPADPAIAHQQVAAHAQSQPRHACLGGQTQQQGQIVSIFRNDKELGRATNTPGGVAR